MELKDLTALFLIAVAISGGVLTTCLSQRARDAANMQDKCSLAASAAD